MLAQVLGAHDRLLIEQVTGTGLLFKVTLDHVYCLVYVLASKLSDLLLGDGCPHLLLHLLLRLSSGANTLPKRRRKEGRDFSECLRLMRESSGLPPFFCRPFPQEHTTTSSAQIESGGSVPMPY